METVRLEGLAAYADLYRVLSDTGALERFLADRAPPQASEVRDIVAGLPAPVETLPLRVLAALGHHARMGRLEWFYWMAADGVITTQSSTIRPVSEALRSWSERHSETFSRLFITTSNADTPWIGWRPPPGDGPIASGRVSWDELSALATGTTALAGATLGTIAFVLVRDWSFDLLPLFAEAALDLNQIVEDLGKQVSASIPPDPSTEAVQQARSVELALSAEVGLPTCAWTIFATLVGITTQAGLRVSNPIQLTITIDLAQLSLLLRQGRSVQLKARPSSAVTRDYWTVDDRLGYDFYADAITAFILHSETVPPLTIGIKGAWGSGKTSLMRMVRAHIDPDPTRPFELRLTRKAQKVKGHTRTGSDRVTVKQALDLSRTPTPEELEPVADEASRQQDRAVFRPTVWFNAWMYQSSEQIWAGLADAIISQISERLPAAEREEFWLRLTLSRVDTSAIRQRIYRVFLERLAPVIVVAGGLLGMAVAVAFAGLAFPAITGTTWAAAGGLTILALPGGAVETARRWKEFLGQDLATAASDIVKQPDYAGRLGFLSVVQADMKRVLDLVSSPERPVVVFVDDLDRCSQATITQVIEAVNLFLGGQFPNSIFILAMEPDIVAANIDVSYSQVLDHLGKEQSRAGQSLGWRFLEKMVQLPLTLPRPVPGQIERYVEAVMTHGPASRAPLDQQRIARLQTDIRSRANSIGEMRPAAIAAQQALTGDISTTELIPETIAAAEQAFSDSFTDQDPAVRATIVRHAAYLSDNPREIKRFINLFRFYAFIQVRRELRGFRTPTLDQVAKIAILAIRWPELLAGLLQLSTDRDAGTVLAKLEGLARAPKMPGQAVKVWREQLKPYGLDGWRPLVAAEELHQLLARDPEIADWVTGFL